MQVLSGSAQVMEPNSSPECRGPATYFCELQENNSSHKWQEASCLGLRDRGAVPQDLMLHQLLWHMGT